jgi:hypothetical protein
MIIQRSPVTLEIHDLKASHSLSSTLTASGRGELQILEDGWWWVGEPNENEFCWLLLATTVGIELYKIGPQEVATGSYKPVAVEKIEASWCHFEPIKQIVVLATGKFANVLRVYKVNVPSVSGAAMRGSAHLGGRELLRYANTEVELMRPSKGKLAEALSRDDVLVAQLYSSLYILRMDPVERKLYLHAVGGASRPHAIDVFHKSPKLEVTVLDNVLILHDMVMKSSMMYDIKLSVDFPVIAPCAILPPRNPAKKGQPAVKSPGDVAWLFPQPFYVLDSAAGLVNYMVLDLEEIVHMSTDKVWLMEFLLRRRGSKRWVRALLLDSMIAGESLPTVAKLLKLVNAFYYFIYYRCVWTLLSRMTSTIIVETFKTYFRIQKRAPEHESDAWDQPSSEGSPEKAAEEVVHVATGIALSIVDDHFASGDTGTIHSKKESPSQSQALQGGARVSTLLRRHRPYKHLFAE